MDDDEYCSGDDNDNCQTCGGDGYGIEGEDWEMDDPINGSWTADDDGISLCPNCGGSGDADDQTYW